MINISDRNIVSSNRISAFTDSKGDITNKNGDEQVITIPDQDTASPNQFSALANNNDDNSITKVCENFQKIRSETKQ